MSQNTRLPVQKTYKLFIDGKFPRTESGRSWIVKSGDAIVAHACHASRKDLREAVEAARKAQVGWSNATAYNRGQVLYRIAEMMEGKRNELIEALTAVEAKKAAKSAAKNKGAKPLTPEQEVNKAIDRVVYFAGWADKYAQVLGCNNPVAGPYYNFTVPEATGVVGVIAPDENPLLSLVSLMIPVICSGNAAIAFASSTNPLPACVLAEVCATSDVPGGVVNILTGSRSELLAQYASHRDIDGIHAGGLTTEENAILRAGIAENIKRTDLHDKGVDWADDQQCNSVYWIEPFVEMKTIWHPASV